jgi:hypothetical protein
LSMERRGSASRGCEVRALEVRRRMPREAVRRTTDVGGIALVRGAGCVTADKVLVAVGISHA